MKNSSKKCLVTGGAGFIGSHLAEALLRDGHEVIVIDNFSNGRMQNMASFKDNVALKIVEADIRNISDIRPHFEGVDIVFHLAALADIVPSIVTPLKYYDSNVTGTANVVEVSRLSGVKKLIYTASSSCYGIPSAYPTPETAPIDPQYPYALTKYLGEEIVFHWAGVYKMSVISLRLFNVYGHRSRTSGTYGAVFGVFLAQKLNNRPFTVIGDGGQTRDFIYVSDVVEAFLKAASSEIKNEIFNVGSGRPQSVNKLVSLLGGEVTRIPKRPGEPDCTWADIAKIKSMLGWSPRVSFEEGVGKVLQKIDYWKSAPVWTPEAIEEATHDWFKYLAKG
ncbi:MAG: SDR family oxidoreductase [Candidatus Omnitrophota bacterium]|nr:SDR family oxidoreductase [Candidatus Omnitrophota bacterium]